MSTRSNCGTDVHSKALLLIFITAHSPYIFFPERISPTTHAINQCCKTTGNSIIYYQDFRCPFESPSADLHHSLYSLIGDFSMIWRLRTSSSILCLVHVLIMIYSLFLSLYVFFMHQYVESSLPMFPTFTILHPKVWVEFILRLSKVSN